MVYKWKEASRIKANPDEAAVVMFDLANKNSLDAESLVEVSKPEDAPLHSDFDWNDTEAAVKWRNHQARNIINALVLVPEENEALKSQEPVRAFFKITETQNNYEPTVLLISKPDTREILLRKALGELTAFQNKYSALEELASVMKAIELTKKAV